MTNAQDNTFLEPTIQFVIDRIDRQRARQADFPHITKDGKWVYTVDGVWTGGFWTGLQWLAYKETNDTKFLAEAERLTQRLLPRAHDEVNHDLGFMFYPTAVVGWRLTGKDEYRAAAVQAAESLAKQFNPEAGFIPGWGFFGGQNWAGSVLIDTLMNLPLLVWATQNGGSEELLDVVSKHTETALRNHQRADGSVYHVYVFDEKTGAPLRGDTYQGKAPESSWSRGQGWAVAGLSMLADMTGRVEYVGAAERVAAFIESQLKDSYVPKWDYAVSGDDEPFDSSAGAISAYGLIRLAGVTKNNRYLDLARSILSALSAQCLASDNAESILGHATADLPHGLGIDESTGYGDYYFLKALLALRDATPTASSAS
jgi:unsaturated chondroitin disaccharide hydrolase